MTRTRTSHLLDGSAPSKQPMCRGLALAAVATAAMVAVACSSATVINPGQGGSSGGGGGGGKGGNNTGASSGAGGGVIFTMTDAGVERPTGGNCGDGVMERNEGCDDGNTISGDGCSRICQVESNWNCPKEGQACENLAKCGNNILTSDETCDDGNTSSGDGC